MKIAFIKFGGLSSGGTERWLQYMAKGLAENGFQIDFYYCDSAPYIGSEYVHPDTDDSRLKYLLDSKVNLIKFSVGAKDVTTPDHEWVNTNFWEVFDESQYDLVQTAKAGHPEYPFNRMDIPVCELVTLDAGSDDTQNIAWSILVSQTQRARWIQSGGNLLRSSVIPVPVFAPTSNENLRQSLGILSGDVVAGFHQAPRDEIFSDIPLRVFSELFKPNRHFIILSGSRKYRQQALDLGLRNVHFLDFNSDPDLLSLFLNSLDIFSHGRKDGETFGTVFAEAMIHGKPCLSHISPHGSNGHIETIGPAGYVESDLDSYARRLEELFSNEELRDGLGAIAIEHAKNYYSFDNSLLELIQVYQNFETNRRTVSSNSRLGYALSPLGFLQAGNLEDPSSISHHTLVGGIPEEFDLLISDFFSSRVLRYLDIGANIGLYSPRAKSINDSLEVHAFEPQPQEAKTLLMTKKLNKWGAGFVVHQVALSNSDGETSLHLAGTGSTLESVFLGTGISSNEIVVSKRQLDSFRGVINCKNSFIKVDVEGHELSVLEGARDTISEDRPIWFIEIAKTIDLRSFENSDFEATFQLIQDSNYRCYVSNGRNSIRKYNQNKVADGVFMYLCVPSEYSSFLYLNLKTNLAKAKTRKVLKRIARRIASLSGRYMRGLKRRLLGIFW